MPMISIGFRAPSSYARESSTSSAEAKNRVTAASAKTELDPVLDQPIDTLSKGFKRRVGLAQAILHDPPVLVLDEPTDGLDPNQKHEVRNLIQGMAADKAIIISTHILEEVEAACSRVIIIDRGHVVANGTPQELKARAENAGAVRLTVRGTAGAAITAKLAALSARTEIISEASGLAVVRAYPNERGGNAAFVGSVAELAQREQWKLDEIHVEEGRMDDVFRSITLPDTVRRAA